jgi:hypothetical protein
LMNRFLILRSVSLMLSFVITNKEYVHDLDALLQLMDYIRDSYIFLLDNRITLPVYTYQ